MRPKEVPNGVATDEAMVSGEAPGSEALTIITPEIGPAVRGDRQTKAQNAAQRNGGGKSKWWRPGGGDGKRAKSASTPLYGARSDFSYVQRQST